MCRFQHDVRPVAKQSQETLAQQIDLVIILDIYEYFPNNA